MESQNCVLEEVDQLVELMAVEKETMSREISKLRGEHTDLLERETMLGSENTKLKLENINKQSMLAMQEEQGAKVAGTLKEVMELTRNQLEEARAQVDSLTDTINRVKGNNRTLTAENLGLKEKAKKYKNEALELNMALEIQRTENLKLTSSLSGMREQCRKIQADSHFLKSREKELEERLKIGEDMILALRGRGNSARRIEEQLKIKCSSLERALEIANARPAAVRVPAEKTRVELELIRECKRKEEALITYSNQLCAFEAEQKKQRQQKSKLERTLHIERRKTMRLTRDMETMGRERDAEQRGLKESADETKELRKKLKKSLADLRGAKKKELQFHLGKQEVETCLSHIEGELVRSKNEIGDMRVDLEEKEGRWWEEKHKIEKEKLDLIKAHSRDTARLREQLQHTCGAGDTFSDRDEMLLEEAKEDYQRLKEASTKRCTELAKEVWRLKSLVTDLEEQQCHRLSHRKCPQICIH